MSNDADMQEAGITALHNELVGVKALAPYVPKEEIAERVEVLLNSLANPHSTAVAVSTFAALAKWTTAELISEEAAASKRRAMFATFDAQLTARHIGVATSASTSKFSGDEQVCAGTLSGSSSGGTNGHHNAVTSANTASPSLSVSHKRTAGDVQLEAKKSKTAANIRTLKCSLCSKLFNGQQGLSSHIKFIHKEKTGDSFSLHSKEAEVLESTVAKFAGESEPELEIASDMEKDDAKSLGKSRRRVYTAHEKQAFLDIYDAICQDKSVRSFTEKFLKETGVASSNICKWAKPEMRAQIAASIKQATSAEIDDHERAIVVEVIESVVAQIAGENEPELEVRFCLDQMLSRVETVARNEKNNAKSARDLKRQKAARGAESVKEKRKGSDRRRIYTAHEKQAFLNDYDSICQDKSVRSFTDKFEEETGVAASNISKWSKPEMRAQIAASAEKAAAAALSPQKPSSKKRPRVFAL